MRRATLLVLNPILSCYINLLLTLLTYIRCYGEFTTAKKGISTMHQPIDFHDRVLFDLHQLRSEREAKDYAEKHRKKLPFRIFYQLWDTEREIMAEHEFFLFAPDRIEAKRLGVLYCRNANGQPLDYLSLDVEEVLK